MFRSHEYFKAKLSSIPGSRKQNGCAVAQPHRIGKLEAALDYITSRDGVWNASAAEIVDQWRSQQEAAS